jgi:molybdenum cofactor guanylyltransferase
MFFPMIRRTDLILIGAAARKSGKTTLACRLISEQAQVREVIGLKLTLSHDLAPGSTAPALDSPGFRLVEENEVSARTDTGRMRAAGARRAYWLETRPDGLEAGLEAVFGRVPGHSCIVAEGASARRFIEPGLFILLKKSSAKEEKGSFREFSPLADQILETDDRGEPFSRPGPLFIDGQWMLKPKASAVVLAGGDSRRMGRDKALLPLAGKPMIAAIVDRLRLLFDDILISGGRIEEYAFLNLEVVPDRIPGQGPLMGLASSLPRTKNDLAFVLACDIPDFDLGFVSRLASRAQGFDAVIPANSRGDCEPVFAFYRKSVVAPALAVLDAGGRSILDLLPRIRWRPFELPEGVEIRNINTAEDYRRMVSKT